MNKDSYIGILLQDLRKKNQVLDMIMYANQRQKDALTDPNLDPDEFDKIVEEKAKLIERLEQLDDGFEKIYDYVREELKENKEAHKEEILEMQNLIRQLTEKSASIQAQEQRNKELMKNKFTEVRQHVREIRSSQKVVNQYYQNMMKANYIDPQFMDNKK